MNKKLENVKTNWVDAPFVSFENGVWVDSISKRKLSDKSQDLLNYKHFCN